MTTALPNKFHFYIGVTLAISSTILIGCSFIIKKTALKRLKERGELCAGLGGHGYLREIRWWLGLLLMGLGEMLNFIAYIFAPAPVVTSLGGLSILVSSILAAKFLKEELNFLGKIGCILCVVGSVIVVLNAPTIEEVTNLENFLKKIETSIPTLVLFLITLLIALFVVRWFLGPKNRRLIFYLFICSFFGSLSVIICKLLGLMIKDDLKDVSLFFVAINFFLLIAFICIQINYLNRTLALFHTAIVTPIFYVMFSSMVTATSSALFGFSTSLTNFFGSLFGFLILVIAVFLLSYFNNSDLERFNESNERSLVELN